jgi:hypothetical protein
MDGIAFAMFRNLQDEMACNMAERMQNAVRTGVLVSNLGRLDIPTQFNGLDLAWISPPAVYAGNAEKAVEVLTIAGRMRFTLIYGAINITDETVEHLRVAATKILTD